MFRDTESIAFVNDQGERAREPPDASRIGIDPAVPYTRTAPFGNGDSPNLCSLSFLKKTNRITELLQRSSSYL